MKKNRLSMRFIPYLVLITLYVFTFTSCNKEDDITSEQKVTIVGEWLEDGSSSSSKHFFVATYYESGKVKTWEAYADNTYLPTTYFNGEGAYEYDGSSLSLNVESELGKTTDEYKVREISKYNMLLYYEQTASTDELHRIIDTYEMKVGESKDIKIIDSEFVATSYSSCDKGIVTTDQNGNLKAVKRGTTYIKITSSIGTAIIRVIVNDPDNYFDDGLVYLGESVAGLTPVYGDMYRGNAWGDRSYNLIDDVMLKIEVTCETEDIVSWVTIHLTDNADLDKVYQSLKNKYTLDSDYEDIADFTTQKESREVIISFNKKLKIIEFFYF